MVSGNPDRPLLGFGAPTRGLTRTREAEVALRRPRHLHALVEVAARVERRRAERLPLPLLARARLERDRPAGRRAHGAEQLDPRARLARVERPLERREHARLLLPVVEADARLEAVDLAGVVDQRVLRERSHAPVLVRDVLRARHEAGDLLDRRGIAVRRVALEAELRDPDRPRAPDLVLRAQLAQHVGDAAEVADRRVVLVRRAYAGTARERVRVVGEAGAGQGLEALAAASLRRLALERVVVRVDAGQLTQERERAELVAGVARRAREREQLAEQELVRAVTGSREATGRRVREAAVDARRL